ncbi:hypothetical protein ACFLRG_03485 [Bacteroidota bacterium]
MKKVRLILAMTICVLFVLSSGQSLAQEEETWFKDNKENNFIKPKYDYKTKILYYWDRAGEKYTKSDLKNYEEAMEYIKERNKKAGAWTGNYYGALDTYNSSNGLSYNKTFPDSYSGDGLFGFYSSMGNASNKLSVQKNLDGEDSFTNKSSIDVDEDQKSFSVKFNANCREGKISFSIFSPNNKILKKVVVNEGESRSWSKNIRLNEEENKGKYFGKWEIKVDVKDALGVYKIEASSR